MLTDTMATHCPGKRIKIWEPWFAPTRSFARYCPRKPAWLYAGTRHLAMALMNVSLHNLIKQKKTLPQPLVYLLESKFPVFIKFIVRLEGLR